MEKKYWIGRNRSAMAMARGAVTSEARLIHYELAGRYSIMAAQCLPFAQPDRPRAAGGERAVLHLPDPGSLRPVRPPSRRQEELTARGDPGRSMGKGR